MTDQKTAQENPAQPGGFAVDEAVSPDAHPNGELMAIEEQKRQDTATWEDQQNRSPMDNQNPAQEGFASVPNSGAPIPGQGADAILAKVFVSKTAAVTNEDGSLEIPDGASVGSKVLLKTQDTGETHIGQVVADKGDDFVVEYRDGTFEVEEKKNFEVVVG